MRKVMIGIVFVLLMGGCATSWMYPPIDLTQFTPREQELIKWRNIATGMSEAALLASWGRMDEVRPHPKWVGAVASMFADRYVLSKINRHVSGGRETKQYIYKTLVGSAGRRYVYVQDGRVTGWSL